MKRQITIKEIAEMAKVNPSTVSRVLNGDKKYSITNEVRSRILELADRFSYAPQGTARSLACRQSFNIAIILDRVENDMASSAGAILLGSLCREITRKNYKAILLPASGKDIDAEVLHCIRSSNADAYFIGGLMAGNKTWTELEKTRTPAVTFLGDTIFGDDIPNIDVVSLDVETGYRELFRELSARHFRHMALFFLEEHQLATRRYPAALLAKEYGIDISEHIPFQCPVADFKIRHSARKTALAAMDRLRRQELILCSNDLTALGVCDALEDCGIRPGIDISVVGFDNLEAQPTYRAPANDRDLPVLATIDTHLAEAGAVIADLLLKRIRENRMTKEKLSVKSTFIPRGTLGFPKRNETDGILRKSVSLSKNEFTLSQEPYIRKESLS